MCKLANQSNYLFSLSNGIKQSFWSIHTAQRGEIKNNHIFAVVSGVLTAPRTPDVRHQGIYSNSPMFKTIILFNI